MYTYSGMSFVNLREGTVCNSTTVWTTVFVLKTILPEDTSLPSYLEVIFTSEHFFEILDYSVAMTLEIKSLQTLAKPNNLLVPPVRSTPIWARALWPAGVWHFACCCSRGRSSGRPPRTGRWRRGWSQSTWSRQVSLEGEESKFGISELFGGITQSGWCRVSPQSTWKKIIKGSVFVRNRSNIWRYISEIQEWKA